MAKVSFNKLCLKPNENKVNINYNGQIIEVKQYLPVQEKLDLIGRTIESSHDLNNFSNPLKIQVYTTLFVIEKYTNISFTDKQKENPTKLYDILNGNGIVKSIINAIPDDEYNMLIKGLYDTIESVYKYQNSALGILDAITQDYQNIDFDINSLSEKISDPEALSTLKNLAEFSGFVKTDE